jgi:hypothetical protein
MKPDKDRTKVFFAIGEKGKIRLLWKTMRKTRFFVVRIIGAVAVTLFALPGLWAAIGTSLTWKIFLIGLGVYLIATFYIGPVRAVVLGTLAAYLGGIGTNFIMHIMGDAPVTFMTLFWIAVAFVGMLACFSFGLGLITSRKTWMFIREDDPLYHYKYAFSLSNIITRFILFSLLFFLIGVGYGYFFDYWMSWRTLLLHALQSGVGITLVLFSPPAGLALGTYLGVLTRERLNPTIIVAGNVIPYLREMVVPTIAFVMGYLLIVFLFANFYWFMWLRNAASFNHVPPSASLGSFLYFSLVTMATVGYGDITPNSTLARTVVGIEILVGLGWVTLVFAAVIAYLQPRFKQITKKQEAAGPTLAKEIKKSIKQKSVKRI